MAKYGLLLTDTGADLIAQAIEDNSKVKITEVAVGDAVFEGKVKTVNPTGTETSLINEKYRAVPSVLDYKGDKAGYAVFQVVLGKEAGGFTVREVGLYSDDKLVAYGNLPDTIKTVASDGIASEIVLDLYLAVDRVKAITIEMVSEAFATQEYVNLRTQKATEEEVLVGLDDNKVITPKKLKDILKKLKGDLWKIYPMPSGSYLALAAKDSTLAAVGEDSSCAISEDNGVNWDKVTMPAGEYYAITYARNGFVAVGKDVAATYEKENFFVNKWIAKPIPKGTYIAIVSTGSTLVAVGKNGACATSTDHGATWEKKIIPMDDYHSIVYTGSSLVALGTSGSFAKSLDNGNTWVSETVFETGYVSMVYTGSKLIAISYRLLAVSEDGGITWVSIAGPGTPTGVKLFYSNSRLMCYFQSFYAVVPEDGRGSLGLRTNMIGDSRKEFLRYVRAVICHNSQIMFIGRCVTEGKGESPAFATMNDYYL